MVHPLRPILEGCKEILLLGGNADRSYFAHWNSQSRCRCNIFNTVHELLCVALEVDSRRLRLAKRVAVITSKAQQQSVKLKFLINKCS